MNHIITGVDLAKKEIQVCVTTRNKVQSNRAMTPEQFSGFLANSKPMIIVFGACATSNYWKQQALECGHDARLISAKLVANVRQNQKTDKNDVLANKTVRTAFAMLTNDTEYKAELLAA